MPEISTERPIRAIISDIGGVLVAFDFRPIVRRLVAEAGCRLSKEKIEDFLFHSDLPLEYEIGRIDTPTFFEGVKRHLVLDNLPFETFRSIWCDIFTPIPETHALLMRLRKYYPIFLLSNTNPLHIEWLRERDWGGLNIAHDVILSYEVGVAKPDRRIYDIALDRIGLLPEECVYIDDLLENVDAAKRVGLRAVHYRDIVQLEEELRQMNVSTVRICSRASISSGVPKRPAST